MLLVPMRRRPAALLLSAALCAAAAPAAFAAPGGKDVTPNLRSGNWRVAIAMEIPNASGPATGPLQYERCLTAEDTRNLLMIPPEANCTIRNSELKRESLDWSMQCTQGGQQSIIEGHMEFRDTRVEAKILTVTRNPNMRITTRMSGRYIGPCIQVGSKGAQPKAATPDAKAAPPAKAGGSTLPRYKED